MKTNMLGSKLRGLYCDNTQYLNCRGSLEETSASLQLSCWFGSMHVAKTYYLTSIHNIANIFEQEIYL